MTLLRFDGLRTARGPLTLGQRIVLESLSRRTADADYTYNIDRVVPVPPGADLDAVREAVHALVCRHETLRTRFPDGAREQVVDGTGTLAVQACDSIAEARAALACEPFDVATEWGIRVAVVSRRDRPRSVVLCLSHLAVDAWAANLVVEDLSALLRAPGRTWAATARQPVDQAEAETAPDSLARQADALAHVRQVLLAAPAEPPGATPDPDAWHLGELRSGIVDPAARAVAARCRTTAAVVYLAAAAAALGAGGHVLKTISHNRLTPAEMACVAPFAMDMFVPVEVSGETFEALVARTWEDYRRAARHSRYDPSAVRPIVAEVTAERGTRPDLSVLVNDLRSSTRPRVPTATSPVASTFRWGEPVRLPGLTRYLAITDDGDAVTLSLLANGVALPRERLPAFLRRMEGLIVAAADGDTTAGTRSGW
ncbi:condensation domain-containing protein [Streptomyces sp. NPDC001981]|uniref:condensation domain-containing protein n=1 Tax=Streptomyces sp. NPDC001981 TaxID=3364628 RepID=UPI00369F89D0